MTGKHLPLLFQRVSSKWRNDKKKKQNKNRRDERREKCSFRLIGKSERQKATGNPSKGETTPDEDGRYFQISLEKNQSPWIFEINPICCCHKSLLSCPILIFIIWITQLYQVPKDLCKRAYQIELKWVKFAFANWKLGIQHWGWRTSYKRSCKLIGRGCHFNGELQTWRMYLRDRKKSVKYVAKESWNWPNIWQFTMH